MASIYLVNAMYKKPSVPASSMQSATPIKSDQPVATVEQSAPASEINGTPTETQQPKIQQQQAKTRSESEGAMNPARQQMIDVLGPLEEEPKLIIYKPSGANCQALGREAPPNPFLPFKAPLNAPPVAKGPNGGKGAKPKQNAPTTSKNIQAARERSFQAVAPSATAAARLSQHLQALGGNRINPGLDPRLRKRTEESQEASSPPSPAGGFTIKQEEPEQFERKMSVPPEEAAPPRLSFHPMVGRDQLHRPPMGVVLPVGTVSEGLFAHVEHPESDQASDSEARIRELEDENLVLLRAGFDKDREIRKLKAELHRLRKNKGVHTGAAAFQAGMKRPRYEEEDDVHMADGPVREL